MVEVNTKAFGKIAVEDDKLIRFEHGILGFPDLKDFTLIYDIDKGNESAIKWLQSIQEPGFAMPVMNPDLVVSEDLQSLYNSASLTFHFLQIIISLTAVPSTDGGQIDRKGAIFYEKDFYACAEGSR